LLYHGPKNRWRAWRKIAGLIDIEFGAALQVPSSFGIPHEFQLVIETNQVTRQCRVIWRKEKRLGVTFD
jgi:hypothetical protein